MRKHSLLGVVKKSLIGAAVLFSMAGPGYGAVIFQDDFETGNKSKTMNGFRWTNSSNNVTISSARAKGGKYAMEFLFRGKPSGQDSTSEQNFDMGQLYKELWISYDLYIPSNYKHRDETPNNNKFLRIWPKEYSDPEKIGFQTWAGNYSTLKADWAATGKAIGPKGQSASGFVSASDLGKWMSIKIYVKAATASQYGTIKLWKNGLLVIDDSNLMNNYSSGGLHAWRYGYLFGWANSGFSEDTKFYIDNIVFSTTQPSTTTPTMVLPQAPHITVE